MEQLRDQEVQQRPQLVEVVLQQQDITTRSDSEALLR
jgi:hypothetical protein